MNYERQNALFKYLVMGYGKCNLLSFGYGESNFLSFDIQAVDLIRQCCLSMCLASVLSSTVSYKPEDIEGEMCSITPGMKCRIHSMTCKAPQ